MKVNTRLRGHGTWRKPQNKEKSGPDRELECYGYAKAISPRAGFEGHHMEVSTSGIARCPCVASILGLNCEDVEVIEILGGVNEPFLGHRLSSTAEIPHSPIHPATNNIASSHRPVGVTRTSMLGIIPHLLGLSK